jgi:hypothetical protein
MLRRHDKMANVIVSVADIDGDSWIHASMAGHKMPTYDDLALLHKAAFGDGWAYQAFAPEADHVNIHQTCLHLWGRADGQPAMPNFGAYGVV